MMRFGRKTITVMIALSLAIASFLQPLQALAFFMPDKYFYSTYYAMDKEVYTKYGSYGDVSEWTKCGNFYYEHLSEPYSHFITIRRVEEAAIKNGVLTIPSQVDGYRVIGVGAINVEPVSIPDSPYTEGVKGNGCILKKPELLREVVFLEGIEIVGQESFFECSNLERIHFPESLVYIRHCAFLGCEGISELAFPQGVVSHGSPFGTPFCPLQVRKTIMYSNMKLEFVPNGKNNKKIKSELYIKYYEQASYDYQGKGYLEKLYVSPGISKFNLSGVTDWAEELDRMVSYFDLNRLIINARCTELKITSIINLSGIYTVEGAKAIREARKHNIPYYIKKTGKTQKIKGKKKSGQYKASWKKVSTKIERHARKNNWKGKILKKKVKTKYKIYGRSKKTELYKKICTTGKNSIQTKYKYIKVVPVKEWD